MGYSRAGFEVTGVDIVEQPHYPFRFFLNDAIGGLADLASDVAEYGRGIQGWTAIHASPPCQWGTAYGRRPNHVKDSPNLVPQVRELLEAIGLPYVIEQPWENRGAMILDRCIVLRGDQFDLDVMRRRIFESNVPWPVFLPPYNRAKQTPRFPPATNRTNLRRTVEVGVYRIPLATQKEAMGVDWDVTLHELSQAIPPAYTEWIGKHLLERVAVDA
jgi:DNA (cytosine-5)-methyltransferase 1